VGDQKREKLRLKIKNIIMSQAAFGAWFCGPNQVILTEIMKENAQKTVKWLTCPGGRSETREVVIKNRKHHHFASGLRSVVL